METLILLVSVIAVIVLLTLYYSLIVNRSVSVLSPVLVPSVKAAYAKFLKWDEKVSGTKRRAPTKHEKDPDRYAEMPAQRVSTKIVGMVLAILTLYINKKFGVFLVLNLIVFLCFEPVVFLTAKRENSRVRKAILSGIPQIIVSVSFFIAFGSSICGFLWK